MDPVIGISLGYEKIDSITLSIRENYIYAIKQAGGIPILLPPQINKKQLISFNNYMDGIFLSGGCDIDPVYFNQEPAPNSGRIDPIRDEFEINITHWAIQKKIPILAICRGMQLLNIACGGTVIQHLKQKGLKHFQNAPYWHATHGVKISPDNKLQSIFKKSIIRVNSFHHQSIGKPGDNIIIAAEALDGVSEAIVKSDHPFAVGVQWHPERMFDKHPEHLKLFQAFIKKCKQHD